MLRKFQKFLLKGAINNQNSMLEQTARARPLEMVEKVGTLSLKSFGFKYRIKERDRARLFFAQDHFSIAYSHSCCIVVFKLPALDHCDSYKLQRFAFYYRSCKYALLRSRALNTSA